MSEIPYTLISKNFCGESSPDEDEALAVWLGSDPRNITIFEECVVSMSGNVPLLSGEDLDTRLDKIQSSGIRFSIAWKIAAGFMLIALVPALLWMHNLKQPALASEVKMIDLPDGSEVWVNKNSKVIFDAAKFSNSREIAVLGEACIRVKENDKPFLIYYGDGIVARLTSGEITIKNYADQREKIATISNGFVAFLDARGIVVEASTDDQVVANSEYGLVSTTINTNLNFNSWMTGVYAFDETPLAIIVLENFGYDQRKLLTPTEQAKLISGVFELNGNHTVEDLLKALKK